MKIPSFKEYPFGWIVVIIVLAAIVLAVATACGGDAGPAADLEADPVEESCSCPVDSCSCPATSCSCYPFPEPTVIPIEPTEWWQRRSMPAWWIDAESLVHFEGALVAARDGDYGTGAPVAFEMPPGARPSKERSFFSQCVGESTRQYSSVVVFPDGKVTVGHGVIVAGQTYYLDGVAYRAEQ